MSNAEQALLLCVCSQLEKANAELTELRRRVVQLEPYWDSSQGELSLFYGGLNSSIYSNPAWLTEELLDLDCVCFVDAIYLKMSYEYPQLAIHLAVKAKVDENLGSTMVTFSFGLEEDSITVDVILARKLLNQFCEMLQARLAEWDKSDAARRAISKFQNAVEAAIEECQISQQ